ncbi:hypothetical protein LINPERHAP1_LOCUS22163 [Linum perenne]
METQFGRFTRLCGASLPLATDASQYVEITDFVDEQLKQLHEDVCAKLFHLRFVKPTRTPTQPRGSASTPKDDDLLATKGFKMRVNPNKSSKRMQSSNEKIRTTNANKRKQKKLIEKTILEVMGRNNK